MTSENHGLSGGTLDATKHLAAAEARLCYPSEVAARKRMLAELSARSALRPSRTNPGAN